MQHILVLLDSHNEQHTEFNQRAISCAQHICEVIGGAYSLLVNTSTEDGEAAHQWQHFGAREVYYVDLGTPEAASTGVIDCLVRLLNDHHINHVVGPGTQSWREFLQRLSGATQWQIVSDVTHVEMTGTGTLYHKPWLAGEAHTGRRLTTASAIFTPASGAYGRARPIATASVVVQDKLT